MRTLEVCFIVIPASDGVPLLLADILESCAERADGRESSKHAVVFVGHELCSKHKLTCRYQLCSSHSTCGSVSCHSATRRAFAWSEGIPQRKRG